MILRHAAALALVGWYLMVPPFRSGWFSSSATELDTKAPLSRWRVIGSFDEVASCYYMRKEYRRVLHDPPGAELGSLNTIGDPDTSAAILKSEKNDVVRKRLDSAKCFAADDPRLAK